MSEFITEIPNLEKGKTYTINVCDSESALIIIKELVYRLCVTYGTAVGYIGLTDKTDAVREQCSDCKSAAVLNCIKQDNPDCSTVIRRMEGLYNRRFVRAFIIDGADRLKVSGADGKLMDDPSKVATRLDLLANKKKVPIVTIVAK